MYNQTYLLMLVHHKKIQFEHTFSDSLPTYIIYRNYSSVLRLMYQQ